MASASVATPAAGATIVGVNGFQTWQQTDIYRIDWTAFYDTANGPIMDMAIFLGAQQAFILPVPIAKDVLASGTIFVEAGDMDVSIRAIAGSGTATYAASLVMTRLLNGFRAG